MPSHDAEPDAPARAGRARRTRAVMVGRVLTGVVVLVAVLLGAAAFATLASLDPTGDDVLAAAGAWLTLSAVLGGIAALLIVVTLIVALVTRRGWAVVAAVLSVVAPLLTLFLGVYGGIVVATDNAMDGLDALGGLVSRTGELVERQGGDGELLREIGRTIDGS